MSGQLTSISPVDGRVQQRATELFEQDQETLECRTDRLFAWLMIGQWLAGIAAALWISPRTWAGASSSTHIHVYAAIILGGIITAFPVTLAFLIPGRYLTRHVIAAGQMLTSALLIHLTGGRIETHFHVFGSLAFLAFYRDWRVLITASVVIALDHLLRGLFWPQSVYGVVAASPWRALEHAGWVVFEDCFLFVSIQRSLRATREMAMGRARIESSHELVERQVEERTRALRTSEAKLAEAQMLAGMGSWEWDLSRDVITWSDGLWRVFGVDREAFPVSFQGMLERIHPDDRPLATQAIEQARRDHQPFSFEHRILRSGSKVRTVQARGQVFCDDEGRPTRMAGTAQDITERKQAEQSLAVYAAELARSNGELEQFASVASHDLQEPLRMVTSYVQLLARRYRGQIHKDADEFINFAVDGAERMQGMIQDLLTYSRVGRQDNAARKTVDCGAVVAQVLTDLGMALRDSGARVSCEDLPELTAEHLQLQQLFQNLISNALKFRGEGVPEIHVGARREGENWQFWVKDNGIGIEPEYVDRIFDIFKRLHTREQYPGTGIGLAICRKIVERQGGRIWVESEPGRGSTFYFTLPASEGVPEALVA